MSIEYEGPMSDDFKAGEGDGKLLVMFREDILRDEGASIEQGRPIYQDTVWVKIFIPGDKTTVLDRPASDIDKRRFALQYARFQQGLKEEAQIPGTPLREWPLVTRSQVEELRYFHVVTVENLAEINDQLKLRIPGLSKLSEQAKIWLAKTSATAEAAKAQAQIEAQDNRIDVLERTVRELIQDKQALEEKLKIAA